MANISEKLCSRNDFGWVHYWFFNKMVHREDGPAMEYERGTKVWYIKNVFHREDGSAIMRHDGSYDWYLDGVKTTEEGVLQHAVKNNNKDAIKSILWRKYVDRE